MTGLSGRSGASGNAMVAQPQGAQGSLITEMAGRHGIAPKVFELTLRKTILPANCSDEQFAAFLLVAKQHNLNPLTREIFAFPAKGGGIIPVVSIDGWMRIINEQPMMNGLVFEDHRNEETGEVEAITAKIYRKDRDHPVAVTEYMEECRQAGKDTWTKWPRRMLRHKAAIQCARYAFGFSGIYDPDEAERMKHVEGAGLGGQKAKSAAQSKRDGDYEAFVAEISELNTLEEWEAWRKKTELQIAKLPPSIQFQIDEAYELRGEEIGARIADEIPL